MVTGKGGTGKTTVAAALALALAAGGRRTLVVEVEGRQGLAQLFDTPPLPYEERRIASAPGGGEVRALAVDVEEALLEYLEMFYNLRSAGRALRTDGRGRLRHHDRAGHAGRAAHRQGQGGGHPHRGRATGCTTRSSWTRRRPGGSAGSSTSPPRSPGWPGSARSRRQSDGVMAVLRSPQTAVHLVTLLEEMPVQETVDAVGELRAARPAGRRGHREHDSPAAAARAARWPRLPPAGSTRPSCAPASPRRGLDAKLAPTLAAEAAEHAERWQVEDDDRDALAALDLPTIELPFLPGAGRPRRPLRAGRAAPAGRGGGVTRGHGSAAPHLDLDAVARRPGDPDRRLLRLRRGRQDHHRRGARRCAPPRRGRTVVVLTIDPARRLAQSMGLTELDNTPREVPGVDPANGGELHAMMLDMKRTFDEIVSAHSDAGAGRADLRQPVLPVAVALLRRDAGVHGDGEAVPAAGRRTSGT